MRKFLIATTITLVTTSPTFAAKIKNAHLDDTKQNILIDITYGGGCGQNEFSLELQSCSKTQPVECTADLVQKSNDACEGLVHQTIAINLKKSQIESNVKLNIIGDQDWKAKRASSATVLIE
jgi:hypothetical protein